MRNKPKIIAIVGPTASGKSDLAVRLAKQLNGEVISADSRQVYRGLDIGTGKITKKEMRGIPHHLLDVISPKQTYTVSQYAIHAENAVNSVLDRGKIPIICGGTGFYISALVDGILLPDVKPNPTLRKKLETKAVSELFLMLKKIDPKRAASIDKNNPRRLIRAIEIALKLGKVPQIKKTSRYNSLWLGIHIPHEILKKRIHVRLQKRMKNEMIAEAQRLHRNGLTWKRMEALGLEYRYLAFYLQKKLSKKEFLNQLETAIGQYAKRQMTWFAKEKRIHWITICPNGVDATPERCFARKASTQYLLDLIKQKKIVDEFLLK